MSFRLRLGWCGSGWPLPDSARLPRFRLTRLRKFGSSVSGPPSCVSSAPPGCFPHPRHPPPTFGRGDPQPLALLPHVRASCVVGRCRSAGTSSNFEPAGLDPGLRPVFVRSSAGAPPPRPLRPIGGTRKTGVDKAPSHGAVSYEQSPGRSCSSPPPSTRRRRRTGGDGEEVSPQNFERNTGGKPGSMRARSKFEESPPDWPRPTTQKPAHAEVGPRVARVGGKAGVPPEEGSYVEEGTSMRTLPTAPPSTAA